MNYNGLPQPDPDIYNHYTVNNAGFGSRSDTVPEQSFDTATTGFSSKAEGAVVAENVENKSFVDSDTETLAHTPSKKIAPPMGVTVTSGFSVRY